MPATKTTKQNDYGFGDDYAEYEANEAAGTMERKLTKKTGGVTMKSTSTRPL